MKSIRPVKILERKKLCKLKHIDVPVHKHPQQYHSPQYIINEWSITIMMLWMMFSMQMARTHHRNPVDRYPGSRIDENLLDSDGGDGSSNFKTNWRSNHNQNQSQSSLVDELNFDSQNFFSKNQNDILNNLDLEESSLRFRLKFNFTEVNLANSHLFYIRRSYSCSTPRAKVVKVWDYHKSINKRYVPRCTVVHRCDDESGCCEDLTHRCAPSKTEMVELYFHVIRYDVRNDITGGNAVGIERLPFLNHTQCECKPINYMPRSNQNGHNRQPLSPLLPMHLNYRPSDHQEGHHHKYNHKCKHVIECPHPFVRRFRGSDQRCICDCVLEMVGRHQHQQHYQYRECLRIQAGQASLDPIIWSKCLENDKCSEPVCPYGSRFNRIEYQCQKTSFL